MSILRPNDKPVLQQAFAYEETSAEATGLVQSGYMIASLYNSGSTVVTIAGQEIPAGSVVNRPFVGKPYGEDISYDSTGGTILITVIY